MKKIYLIILILIAGSGLYFIINSYSGKSFQSGKKESLIGRRQLLHELYLNGGIIIYPSSNAAYSKIYAGSIENIVNGFRRIMIKPIADTSVTINDLGNNSIFVVGTYESNTVLRKLSGQLPVKFSKSGFSFNKKTYNDSTSLVTLLYPNPWNKNKAMYLISGNSDRYISNNISVRLTGDINIFENGMCEVMDTFKMNDSHQWTPDLNNYRDFGSMKKTYSDFAYYKYIVYSKSTGAEQIRKTEHIFSGMLGKMKDFFSNKISVHKTTCYIFDSFENKGLITRNTSLENTDFNDSTIRLVLNDWIKGDDYFSNAQLILRQNLGKPETDFLETGLAMHFTSNWRRKGFKFWAALIAESGNIPELGELLDNNKLQFISPLIAGPLAGMFVDFLIDKYGKTGFLNVYKNFSEQNIDLNRFQNGWELFLEKLTGEYKNEINNYKKDFNKKINAFQKGFCFAHVGYDIYNGYLSEDAKKSIEKIKSIGANSFSITPFTSVRDASVPEPLRFWEFAGAENDESMIFLSHVAFKKNMTLMMKPQIYLGRNLWPGDIKMKSKKDWELFFHYYYNWIVHYAMISEMYNIPVLCIGNELGGATVGHEKDWIKLTAKIRRLYNGKITYGANWSNEFENLTFWKAFNYIGLSEYYPISNKDNPTDKELFKGAESVMNNVENICKKYDRQAIFTEVGFRSTGRPWKTAMESAGRDSINLISQARCYNALLKASYGRKWLAGMYWWKWPSYLTYGGVRNNNYIPNNKPAQSVIEKWYTKKWN